MKDRNLALLVGTLMLLARVVLLGCADAGAMQATDGGGAYEPAGGGEGDVSGPDTSTDNALALWNGVDGDTLKDGATVQQPVLAQPSLFDIGGGGNPNVFLDHTSGNGELGVIHGSSGTRVVEIRVVGTSRARFSNLTANGFYQIHGDDTHRWKYSSSNDLLLAADASGNPELTSPTAAFAWTNTNGNTVQTPDRAGTVALSNTVKVVDSCTTADCTASATCPSGSQIVYGMFSGGQQACDGNPSQCTNYCEDLGGTSCSVTESSANDEAGVMIICG